MNNLQMIKSSKSLVNREEKQAERMLRICQRANMSEEEVRKDIRRINEKGILKINPTMYGKWDMHWRDEAELEKLLQLLKERRNLKASVQKKLRRIDEGHISLDSLQTEIEACQTMVRKMISDSMVEKYASRITAAKAELLEHHDKLEEILADMELMFFLFGYTYEEYIAFRFMDKQLAERLTFLSGAERRKVLIALNDEDACELFHDKHACYEKFKRYFRRKQVCVYDKENLVEFEKFCKKTGRFVKKPLVAHKGKGVEPIYIEKDMDLKKLRDMLLAENGPFVVEEMIETHEVLKAMNPDSVNTVRVETFFDGRKAYISNAFFRVGKAGFFVDNGSAGGIIIPIDLETGMLMETGRDKTNTTYTVHPDTGIAFKGYQIPNWKQLIKLSQKLASIHPSVKYVGWDLTLNRRGKWVVVEGNARPGGLGIQRSSDKGTRTDFFRIIQKHPNDFR